MCVPRPVRYVGVCGVDWGGYGGVDMVGGYVGVYVVWVNTLVTSLRW